MPLFDLGQGNFALKSFVPGDFLLQYPGKVIDAKEDAEREVFYQK